MWLPDYIRMRIILKLEYTDMQSYFLSSCFLSSVYFVIDAHYFFLCWSLVPILEEISEEFFMWDMWINVKTLTLVGVVPYYQSFSKMRLIHVWSKDNQKCPSELKQMTDTVESG